MPFLGGRASASRGFFGGGSTPTAPTNLSAIEGNQQLTISFDAPSFNGGLNIANYEYALSTDSGSSYGAWTPVSPIDTTSPVTIGGLSNGQQYYVKLRATNALGGGQESSPLSTNTTPFTTPGAPVISVARQASQTLRITLVTPAPENGRTVTSYEYRIKSSGSYGSYIALSGTTGPWDIGSLANGTSYTVQVRGVNIGGAGLGSNEPSATPFTIPDKVGTPTSSSGDRRFTITWSAPGNGGSAITAYKAQYSADDGATWVGTVTPTTSATSHTFVVPNGISYRGRVLAINAAGDGTYSDASTARTPTFAAPALSVTNVPGYGNPGDSNTWYKRPIRVAFSPTVCENYRDTYVYVTVSGGFQQNFGPYTSAANQTFDVVTYTDVFGSTQNIPLNKDITVTATTFNSEGHAVSTTVNYNTGAGILHYTYTNSTWATNTIKVTGTTFSRTYFDWFALRTESVRSAVVRANTSSSSDNTVRNTRNPSIGLSSAASSTGTGGGSITLMQLNSNADWPISGGTGDSAVYISRTWGHDDLNTAYDATIDDGQRYSVVGGGTLTGTWAAANQINVKLTVNYQYRTTNYI